MLEVAAIDILDVGSQLRVFQRSLAWARAVPTAWKVEERFEVRAPDEIQGFAQLLGIARAFRSWAMKHEASGPVPHKQGQGGSLRHIGEQDAKSLIFNGFHQDKRVPCAHEGIELLDLRGGRGDGRHGRILPEAPNPAKESPNTRG